MKKIFLPLILVSLFLSGAAPASAIDYAPLEPLPGLQGVQNIDFPQFLGAVFKLLITAGALFAVILLVWGGIAYILSGGGVEVGEAKKRIWAALYGFLILVGAWLMLYTINPTLLNFNLSSIGSLSGNPATNQNTSGNSGTINITVNGGGIPIYTSGSGLTSQAQINKYQEQCASKGLTFKPTSNTGEDPAGEYTYYACQ